MTPTEVQEKLKLSQLKDKIWYVVPSCATTGEGLFEGLVSYLSSHGQRRNRLLMIPRAGSQIMSRHLLKRTSRTVLLVLFPALLPLIFTIPLYIML